MAVSPLSASLIQSSGQLNSGAVSSSAGIAAGSVATSTSNAAASPSSERIAQAVNQVNDILSQKGQNLQGSIDKDKISGVFVYKIIDTETNEVVRQLPPREVVAFAQSLAQPQGLRGLLIQETS